MPKRLPVKLNREPLVEATCQLRVTSQVALNTVFPGYLLAKHPGDVSELQQLPAAMFPEPMRMIDPELAYVPRVRFKFKGVLVMIGERSVAVTNPAPYLGWLRFKDLITEVFNDLLASKLISGIERLSIKYLNVLKANEEPNPQNALAWNLRVGGLELDMRTTHMRTEIRNNGLVTIVQLIGGAIVQAQGQAAEEGSLIDIDTVQPVEQQELGEFADSLSDQLDRVRRVNKEVFFECLTDEAVMTLGPTYE
ncbi:TIGR04255 family protein [Rhodanobacter ginsenosidimutans]|uniref:TIGR04255 family protein n=1 Tax=Rhodanobacter ginsenosidimutans TaxID=490571 RepID=A0ABW0JR00_9GAMM